VNKTLIVSVTVALVFLSILNSMLNQDAARIYNYVFTTIFPAVVVVLSAILYAKSQGELKLFLFALTISTSFDFLAELSWNILEISGFDVFPSIADLFWIVSYIPILWLTLRRLKIDIEFISLRDMILPIAVLWVLVFVQYPILVDIARSDMSVLEKAVSMAYPALDTTLLLLLCIVFVLYLKLRYRSYWLILIVAYAFATLGDLSFAYLESYGIYYTGSLPDVFFNLYYSTFVVGLLAVFGYEVRVVTLEDIEREKKRLEELYKRAKELQDILSLTNKMLRHDVLNNLQLILGYLELYRDVGDRMLIDKAIKAIENCSEYINRIRELERIVTDGELKPIDIGRVVKRILEKYNVMFDIDGNCIALANDAFESVVDNIISNAVKHGQTDRIDVKILKLNGECEIRIADYGKGIPHEIRDKVFDEEFKFGECAGIGLGLYIVKRLIEKYEGRIWIEDNEPSGTVFVIRLKSCSA